MITTSEVLIGIDEGIVKAWAVHWLPVVEQWDPDMVFKIRGSPKSWGRDIAEDSYDVNLEEDDDQ